MKIFSILALSLLATSFSAQAAVVHSCDNLDSIDLLVAPVKSYAQGAVRVAHVSTDEPAAAPDHILVYVSDGETGSACFAISADSDYLGFSWVAHDRIRSSYDPKKGLLLSVPVYTYDHENGGSKPAGSVKIRVSRKNNEPKVSLE